MTTEMIYLQTAACGRPSAGTVAAMVDHLRLEVEVGGYAAQAASGPVLQQAYEGLGSLLGADADGVVIVAGATDGLLTLLGSWAFPEGATVGVVPAEWGPNLDAFARFGLRPVLLPVDDRGVLDLEAFEQALHADPPALVHLTQLASHRCVAQPVAEAVGLCRTAEVPLWADAAQALGHLDTATGADAVYAPARKWLAGPRGVGVLAVNQRARDRLSPLCQRPLQDESPIAAMRHGEVPVAAQVGFAHAVREYLEAGPDAVRASLAALGQRTREAVRGLPGWSLADPADAVGAVVGLRPTAGQDVEAVVSRLRDEDRILTTACLPWRAAEMDGPLLRLAPEPGTDEAALACLTRGLG
ncbi:aminotransferase class V-fold PLP-dependent enzyme [Luteipulveratus flavus]|uniref:Aminotransferase class V-fold PLP-dependent enzyme n=1 Tax=Luteipulveratus flavus TaxID=3031728 RepID=A0ABT6C3R1_9MICO|nr:aminotransferase class V-fold PLP-dependent enzyme [Luteipulveratus sp. YIM 133296]MDF8263301.1 aminotransferase class V-fold PLP-dependent enzyme [Luteipulveratus sp. YIM 133296]